MSEKTFTVSAINCGHCVNTIQLEVGELDGVTSVEASADTKQVTVAWQEPATWDGIKELLVEIDFPPSE